MMHSDVGRTPANKLDSKLIGLMDISKLAQRALSLNTTVSYTRRAPLNAHDGAWMNLTLIALGSSPVKSCTIFTLRTQKTTSVNSPASNPLRVGSEGQLVPNASFKYLGASDITFMMSLTTHVLTIVLATELRDKKAIIWDIIVVKLSTKRPVRDKKARSITRRAFGAPRTHTGQRLARRG